MIVGESWWKQYKYWKKFKAEEEFYVRLQENTTWPFEDIGNGFYYLKLRSDKLISGIALIFFSFCAYAFFTFHRGAFAIPTALFIICCLFGLASLYGNFSIRELLISRQGGYMLRLRANEKILVEQGIHNIYIRLQSKFDTVGTQWFYIIIGGYLLDDIRISRMSTNEAAMRIMGRRLARTMGINYFDYADTTTQHLIYHYSGYSNIRDPHNDLDLNVLYQQSQASIHTAERIQPGDFSQLALPS